MKILMVNTRHFYGGGDSIYCLNLAAMLRSRGHEIAFFAMQEGRNLPDTNADLFVSHIDFKELNGKINLLSAVRVLSRVIYSREARQKFRSLLGRFRPEVVHLHNIHAHITPSIIFEAQKEGIPVVWTLHDYKLVCPNSHFLVDANGEICESCGQGKFYAAILKKCKKDSFAASLMATLEAYAHQVMGVKKRVSRFLTPSAFLKNKVIAGGCPMAAVTHLPTFLPDDHFVKRVEEDHGYLLFVGKIEPLKGITYLSEAAARVPEARLLMVGGVSEPMASRLPAMLPTNAAYLGRISDTQLKTLVRGARALVVPSIWYENQPSVIIEAFAAGKPVIASNLGGMRELVNEGERGLLVPPRNVDALAAAMRWMSRNKSAAREMGRQAAHYALENHSAESHYTKLYRIYNEILIH